MSSIHENQKKNSKIISNHDINGSKNSQCFDQEDEFYDAQCSMNNDEVSDTTDRMNHNGNDHKNPIKTKNKQNVNEEQRSSIVPSADTFLSKFTTWANSTYHSEVTLKFAQYLIWFFSEVFSSAGLRDIYNELNNTRYVLRFFGIPLSVHAIKSGCVAVQGKKIGD